MTTNSTLLSGRFGGSSLAVLEALAYDGSSRTHTPSSSGQPTFIDSADDLRENGAKSTQESSRWGWESRLKEAEEDLRQLKRHNGRSTATSTPRVFEAESETLSTIETTASLSLPELPHSARRPSSATRSRMKDARKDLADSKRNMRRRTDGHSKDDDAKSDEERRPGFGDRWASSVLFDEVLFPLRDTRSDRSQRRLSR